MFINILLFSSALAWVQCDGQPLSKPKDIDSDLDCAIKKFALEYASYIQPRVNS